MYTFIVCLICLVAGYFVYGKIVEKIVEPDAERTAPCYALRDGVDYIPMPTWKVFLIQFLNIAGTGPIFGTILGLLYGPAAYFWIVFGCIFGGAVHDYISAMISLKRNGASLPEIIGDELGNTARVTQRVLALLLMIMVVAVFVKTPAGLLNNMTGDIGSLNGYWFWVVIIFAYYLLAATLPVDKIIGKVYPLFGVVLLFMVVCLFFGIFFNNTGNLPEINEAFANHNPISGDLPLFPGICITIACGAVSGFHATQSPMMARCLKSERYGRRVFYGAMITEGIVAMVWAVATLQFASNLTGVEGDTPYARIYNAMYDPATGSVNPGLLVNKLCNDWLGTTGAVLAILGVVIAPITTGDTAMRCARLISADMFKIKQNKVMMRLLLCLPVFVISSMLLFVKFDVLWHYFSWFNQTFSIFTFFAITVYLAKLHKPYIISLIPGMFMVCVCVTYICVDHSSLDLGEQLSNLVGIVCALATGVWFVVWRHKFISKTSKL
jgi:carbon starvation protein CstA